MSTRLDLLKDELEGLIRAPQEHRQALEEFARKVTATEMDTLIEWMHDFSAQHKDLIESVVDDVWLLIEVEDYLSGDETMFDAWVRFPQSLRDRLRVYLVRTGVEPPTDP